VTSAPPRETKKLPTAGGAGLVGSAFLSLAILYAGIAAVIVVFDRHIWPGRTNASLPTPASSPAPFQEII